MDYLVFAFTFSLIFAPILNLNQELITPNEIDKIFNNSTPDLIGGKNYSNLQIHNTSNSTN